MPSIPYARNKSLLRTNWTVIGRIIIIEFTRISVFLIGKTYMIHITTNSDLKIPKIYVLKFSTKIHFSVDYALFREYFLQFTPWRLPSVFIIGFPKLYTIVLQSFSPGTLSVGGKMSKCRNVDILNVLVQRMNASLLLEIILYSHMGVMKSLQLNYFQQQFKNLSIKAAFLLVIFELHLFKFVWSNSVFGPRARYLSTTFNWLPWSVLLFMVCHD